MSPSRPLLAWSSDTNFSNHSSYAVLADYLPQAEKVTALRQWPKRIEKRLLNRIIRSHAISEWYQLSSIEIEQKISQKIQKSSVDLVHFLWAERDLGYINWLHKKSVPPICCTFHICSDTLPRVIKKRDFIKRLNAVILMSNSQRDFFETCGLDRSRIHVIPHGIDTNFFKPELNVDKYKQFTVLSVGSYRRNFPLMRKVFKAFERDQNVLFKVISSKSNLDYFSDLTNVQFQYGLDENSLLEAYQTASCLLLTVENATANNALLEAMACGLPIISEKIGGIPEYVDDSFSQLSDPGSVEQITDAINELSKNPEKCEDMSSEARKSSLFFDWKNISEKTRLLYENLSFNP